MTPVKTRYLLTSITWPHRGLKCAAHRDHVFFEVDRWPSTFFIGSRAHVMLTCWKPGRKPANGSLGLKFIWIKLFLLYTCFLLLCFEYMVIINLKTELKSNSKQKTSPQSYKTQINILPFPGLAQTGTEQLGQGATLLGWPKSIYY